MSQYVDGFVLPLAVEKIAEYQQIASKAGAIWKEHGAIAYWECVGDDLDVPDMLSFRKIAGCNKDETVVIAWIVYPSREDRDRINAAVMADPRLSDTMDKDKCPFDYRRMAYGGFKELVRYS